MLVYITDISYNNRCVTINTDSFFKCKQHCFAGFHQINSLIAHPLEASQCLLYTHTQSFQVYYSHLQQNENYICIENYHYEQLQHYKKSFIPYCLRVYQ